MRRIVAPRRPSLAHPRRQTTGTATVSLTTCLSLLPLISFPFPHSPSSCFAYLAFFPCPHIFIPPCRFPRKHAIYFPALRSIALRRAALRSVPSPALRSIALRSIPSLLSGASLSGAPLSGASLSLLSGASLSGAPSLLSGALSLLSGASLSA